MEKRHDVRSSYGSSPAPFLVHTLQTSDTGTYYYRSDISTLRRSTQHEQTKRDIAGALLIGETMSFAALAKSDCGSLNTVRRLEV